MVADLNKFTQSPRGDSPLIDEFIGLAKNGGLQGQNKEALQSIAPDYLAFLGVSAGGRKLSSDTLANLTDDQKTAYTEARNYLRNETHTSTARPAASAKKTASVRPARHPSILRTALDGDAEKLTSIMSYDPNINVMETDRLGNNALHILAERSKTSPKHLEALRVLARAPGIDVNAKNDKGEAPLELAILSHNASAAKIFLADPNIELDSKKTYGSKDPQEMTLREVAINLNAVQPDSNLNSIVAMMDTKINTKRDVIALHKAIVQGNLEEVERLSQQKHFDVNASLDPKKRMLSQVPMHTAIAAFEPTDTAQLTEKRIKIVELLLSNPKIDLDVKIDGLNIPAIAKAHAMQINTPNAKVADLIMAKYTEKYPAPDKSSVASTQKPATPSTEEKTEKPEEKKPEAGAKWSGTAMLGTGIAGLLAALGGMATGIPMLPGIGVAGVLLAFTSVGLPIALMAGAATVGVSYLMARNSSGAAPQDQALASATQDPARAAALGKQRAQELGGAPGDLHAAAESYRQGGAGAGGHVPHKPAVPGAQQQPSPLR